jgi:hypothetical protein
MNSKNLLTILITAIVVGGGVYIWQNQPINTQQQILQDAQPKVINDVAPVVAPASGNTDIAEIAKTSNSDFLYLVSSPSLKNTQMVLKDFYGTFSFEYPWNEWREMYFVPSDLTASGGGDPNRFDEFYKYNFCAGSSYCDMTKQEGRGFEMQIWNANYPGRKDDPNFFTKSGEILVKETDKIIITYKPYKGQDTTEATAKLFESFELLK